MPLEHGLYTMAPIVGLLQYKEIQIYNEETSFWMLEEDLELLAMSLVWSSGYLPQILFVHIYMIEPLVYACMPL